VTHYQQQSTVACGCQARAHTVDHASSLGVRSTYALLVSGCKETAITCNGLHWQLA